MAIDDLLAAALAHQKAGRLDQAASLYESILVDAPGQPDALHFSALIALRRGDTDEAIARLQRAAAAAPARAIVHNDLGAALRFAGRLAEAAASLERATALDPRYADAWNNLGIVRRAMNDYPGAGAALERAVALRPDFAPSHNALGGVLRALGDASGARNAFERAIALKPDYVEALTNLGLLLQAEGDPGAAVAPLQKAVALTPRMAEPLLNLGLAQHAAGDRDAALQSLRDAVARNANLAAAWNALGIVEAARGASAASCDALARAVKLDSRSAEFLANFGLSLHKAGRNEEARDALKRALAVDPGYADAIFNRGVICQQEGDFAGALADWKATLEADPGHRLARSNLLFALHYEPAMDGAGLLEEARLFDRLHGRPAQQFRAWANPRMAERRLRIGYVSPDFREHSVAHYIEPLLAAHDPAAVEVFAYAELKRSDAVTERLKSLVGQWRSTSDQRDEDVARQIRADGIDILVDLAGHSAGNRLGVFALKPAPVQVTWLGFPGTTGLSAIDYRLTDALADPAGAEAQSSEILVRLPRGFHCWRPPAGAPPPARRDASRPPSFGSFNNVQKLGADTIAAWSAILRRVPEARLLLKSSWLSRPRAVEALRGAFGGHGIAEERLILSGWLEGAAAHLAAYGDVDVALDPFPYNGTTTTLEALWMGVPVIALAGQRHAGRVGLSLLHQAGARELVCDTVDGYVGDAVALIDDRPRIAAYRQDLRGRLAGSALLDVAGFARDLEAAYRAMWQRWCTAAV